MNPFNINPDPRYLFLNQKMQTALENMLSAIEARKGLILLTGEAGTGKTTLLNRLMQLLREQETPTAFIFNPHLELNELFDMFFAGLGISIDAHHKVNPWTQFTHWSSEQYRMGKNPVLVLDEAQGLPTSLLAEIRLLLNHEIGQEGLIQIVLSGQPELEAKLRRPELSQVRQRVSLRCQTVALKLQEAHEYIQERLRIAGGVGENVFTVEAIDTAFQYSRGIPRVMNLLVEHAMIQAYLKQIRSVPACLVGEAARQLQFDEVKPVPLGPMLETGLGSKSPAGLSTRVADRVAAVEPRAEEREDIPTAMPIVWETPGRPVIETGVIDGFESASDLPSATPRFLELHNETEIQPNPTSELKVNTDSIQKLISEMMVEAALKSTRMPQPEDWKRCEKVVNFKKKSEQSSFLNQSSLPQTLIKSGNWGSMLLTAPRILSHRILAERARVLALVRLPVWQRCADSVVRWLRGPLLVTPSHRDSSGWREVSALAKSLIGQRKIESAVRWLQQPLPNLKLHRRASR